MKPLSVTYKNLHIYDGYRIDLVLDDKLAIVLETYNQNLRQSCVQNAALCEIGQLLPEAHYQL